MSKKAEVKLLMDKNRQLYVKTKDGTEYRVDIFSGGGYYDALFLQTEAEMEESARKRKSNDDKWLADLRAGDAQKQAKKLPQRLKRAFRRHNV